MKRMIGFCAAVLAAGMLVNLAQAAELPAYYPDSFPVRGVIDRIDIKRREIVVNDSFYRLAPVTTVSTPDTRYGTVSRLAEGQRIGATVERVDNARQLKTIWILPDAGD